MTGKGHKGIQMGKEEMKLSLLTDNTIFKVDNLKNISKNLIELIGYYNKVSGYKVNMQSQIIFYILAMNKENLQL